MRLTSRSRVEPQAAPPAAPDLAKIEDAPPAPAVPTMGWRQVAEQSGIVFLRWDFSSGRLIDMSDNVMELIGYTREEFLADPSLPERITHPETRDTINRMIFEWSERKPERVRLEGRFITRNGKEVVLNLFGAPEYNEQGALVGAQMMAMDVTPQVITRRLAQERLQRYQAVFEGSPLAMWLLDPETFTIIEANKEAAKMYGIPRTKLEGSSLLERVVLEEREALKERIQNSAKEGVFDVIPRTMRVRGDGTSFPASIYAVNVQVGGKVRRLTVSKDISEEESIHEWLASYRSAFAHVPAALFIVEAESLLVVEANERACLMYGRDKEEMEGSSFGVVTGDAGAFLAERQLYKAAGSGGPDAMVRRSVHRKADGSPFPVEVSTVTLKDGGKSRRLLLVSDLTEVEFTEGSAAAMRQAIESSQAAVLFIDHEGRILYGSEAAAWLTGRTPDDLIGRNSGELCTAGFESVWEEGLHQAVTGRPWKGRVRLVRAGFDMLMANVEIAPAPSPGGRIPSFLVAVLRGAEGASFIEQLVAQASMGPVSGDPSDG